jgi:Tfp pilus assembly protein FimV
MSVLSTLAVLITIAAVKSKPADRAAELEAEIAGLKLDLADARRDRNEWQARAEVWRERALASLQHQMAQTQWQAAQQVQLAAYQNAQAYGQGLTQHQGLLGAQALDPEMWCNCVPSRAQGVGGERRLLRRGPAPLGAGHLAARHALLGRLERSLLQVARLLHR